MQKLLKGFEKINEVCGLGVAWLTLLMVLITFIVVVMRYVFNLGSIALQESVTYMHAAVFMLGAAYTLKHDAHVRVDIFYRNFNERKKAWVDFLGSLFFLLPVSLFILIISWDYVEASWRLKEGSREAGGLPFVYLLKSLIPAMAVLLIIQGIALLLKNGTIVLTSFSNKEQP